jgi:hypothetical protein
MKRTLASPAVHLVMASVLFILGTSIANGQCQIPDAGSLPHFPKGGFPLPSIYYYFEEKRGQTCDVAILSVL